MIYSGGLIERSIPLHTSGPKAMIDIISTIELAILGLGLCNKSHNPFLSDLSEQEINCFVLAEGFLH